MIISSLPLRDILSWKLKDNSARPTSKVATSTADLSYIYDDVHHDEKEKIMTSPFNFKITPWVVAYMTVVAGAGCPKVSQKFTEKRLPQP